MSKFAQAIRSYRRGACSVQQLLEEVDRQLEGQAGAPDALLTIFDEENAIEALPTELRRAVSERISDWLQDDTVLRTSPRQVDQSATIFLDLPGGATTTRQRAAAVDVGSTLQGRFKLIELVGEGGMSRVYKAIDLRRVEADSQDPHVAVKVLTVPFGDYFSSMQAMHREAHKLQGLAHPNIVRVIDVDRDGQTVFMTMEFLAGQSLQHKLAQGMLSAEAEPIIASIANALEFAHRRGIVHGDLKPGNVIITHAGEVKVIDFGIARFLPRAVEGGVAQKSQWEDLEALTPPYASPEMAEGLEPDPRDDVYAIACIAHELLTGHHPFNRAAAIAARDAGMTVSRSATMSTRQFKAIQRGLCFQRAQRTASVQAFLDEFSGRPARGRTLAFAAAAVVAVGILVGVYWHGRDGIPAPHQVKPALSAGQVFRDCATCPLMRVLPAGKFVQGSTQEPAEQPLHEVTLATSLALATHEVTVGEFQEFAAATNLQPGPCTVYEGDWRSRDDVHWDNIEVASTAGHPVSCVSWDEATAYAQWLSQRTGQSYRLPSAAEWEYAASAGSPAGELLRPARACKIANVADEAAARRYPGWDVLACDDRYVQAAPVASFAANALGLNDMLGNVFEWVQDCWNDTYDGAPADGSPRTDGDCTQHEMRGGSWFTSPDYLRPSYRNRFGREYRSTAVGFRVARDIRAITSLSER